MRGVLLSGVPAAQRLSGLGVVPVAPESDVQVFADSIVVDDFSLSRIWTTVRAVSRRPVHGGISLSFLLAGKAEYASGSSRAESENGGIVAVTGSSAVRMTSNESIAFLTVDLNRTFLETHAPPSFPEVMEFDPELRSSSVLLAAASAALGMPEDSVVSLTGVREVIEKATALVFDELWGSRRQSVDHSEWVVNRRARTVIREQASDPAFDRESLAAALGVSARTLSRAFSAAGSTPAGAIRDERLRLARQLLGGRARVADEVYDEVARAVGIGTGTTLSRALRRAARSSGSE